MSAAAPTITTSFNRTINELIAILRMKVGTDEAALANIERLRARINALKSFGSASALIRDAAMLFYEFTDPIAARDIEYFKQLDLRARAAAVGKQIEPADEFALELVEVVRLLVDSITEAEKIVIFAKIDILHTCSMDWLMLPASSRT